MNLTKYLILMVLATLLSWAAFLIVIFSIDPFATTSLGFALFYLSLFFVLTGSLSIFGFIIRYIFNKSQFINQQVIISFRQAILIAVLILVGLYLQSQNLVTWWNLVILIVLLVVVEFYLSRRIIISQSLDH